MGRGRETETPTPVIGGAGHIDISDRLTGLLRGDVCGVGVGVTTAGLDLSEDTHDTSTGTGAGDFTKEEGESGTDIGEAATTPEGRIPSASDEASDQRQGPPVSCD
mmetsp:Transcript_30063/g.61029  ORF Transcript_30063/g.61029 Transcript_30063/m.61029 type:complete len:106 (+) Transcript_30063:895-1212(+)